MNGVGLGCVFFLAVGLAGHTPPQASDPRWSGMA